MVVSVDEEKGMKLIFVVSSSLFVSGAVYVLSIKCEYIYKLLCIRQGVSRGIFC